MVAVSRGDNAEVGGGDNVRRESNGRSSNDTGRYHMQWRLLTMVLRTVQVTVEIIDQKVTYVISDEWKVVTTRAHII